jgi:hypothetical protein
LISRPHQYHQGGMSWMRKRNPAKKRRVTT